MELKRAAAILLTLSLLVSSGGTLSSYAISENVQKVEGQKVKKNKNEINKLDYINLDFWNSYNDDNLRYFILRAVESNYDLKIAAQNSEIYKHYITAQRAAQMPSIGAGIAPGYTKMPGTSNYDWNFMFPLYVNYEADIFLKNRDKTLLSKKDYEMSLLDERAAYISVASMVGTVYFNILKLEKAIGLQEEIVDLRKETYDLMVLSNEEGITSTQDVIRANKAFIQGNTELINLKKQRLQLINNLAVLIGVRPDEINDFKYSDIESIEYTGIVPKSAESDVIISRPDYMKAEKNVEKTGIDVRVAKKEFLPSISITGLSLFNAGDLGSLFTTENALMGIGGIALADLFTGGRKISNLRVKKSVYEIALQNYEKTNLTAIQEVNDALVAIKHDGIKYEENKKQNELEERDYAIREMRFNEGIISRLDLIQAKENLLSVKKLVLSDKADCFIDYIGFYKAVGAYFPVNNQPNGGQT